MKTIHEVRKRDNRIVPFDDTKIADAIHKALRSVGQADRARSEELAELVCQFLEENLSGTVPAIEEIQDAVETVLINVWPEVAKEYIIYRRHRSTLRETLEVRKSLDDVHAIEDDPLAPGVLTEVPAVDHDVGGIAKWQKSKIAASLIKESDVDPTIAAAVASAVEEKVFSSGMSRLSTSLIRELVDNELFERGYSAKLLKQVPIGMPLYTLEQVIFGSDVKEGYAFPKTPDEVRKIIANRVLHQYSLREVFAPEVAQAHRRGAIFIHRLSDPVRLASAIWSLPLPGSLGQQEAEFPFLRTDDGPPPARRSVPGASNASARADYFDVADFFRRLENLACFFSEDVRLAGVGNLLEDVSDITLSREQRIRQLLERLVHLEDSAQIALQLELGPQGLPWLEAFQKLAQAHPKRLKLLVYLDSAHAGTSAQNAALEHVAALYESGARVEFFGEAGASRDGVPHASRGGFETRAAKITINLPHVALRSARHQRTTLEHELDVALDTAVKGHLERRQFLKRLGESPENPLWELLGRGGDRWTPTADRDYRSSTGPVVDLDESIFTVGVLGLNECVKFLTGSELHQSEAAQAKGLAIVERAAEKLRQDARRLGLRLELEETANVGPLRDLERMDEARYQVEEIDRGRPTPSGPRYTDGVRLHRLAPVDSLERVEALVPYLPFVRPLGGIVEDLPQLRDKALLPFLLKDSLSILSGREGWQAPMREQASVLSPGGGAAESRAPEGRAPEGMVEERVVERHGSEEGGGGHGRVVRRGRLDS